MPTNSADELEEAVKDAIGATNGNYKSVTVDGTATQVLSATSNRTGFIVQNTDANADVYLGYDSSVTAGNGFIIPSNLGTFSDDRYTGPVYMVTGGASVDVRVQELLL